MPSPGETGECRQQPSAACGPRGLPLGSHPSRPLTLPAFLLLGGADSGHSFPECALRRLALHCALFADVRKPSRRERVLRKQPEFEKDSQSPGHSGAAPALRRRGRSFRGQPGGSAGRPQQQRRARSGIAVENQGSGWSPLRVHSIGTPGGGRHPTCLRISGTLGEDTDIASVELLGL